MKKSTMLLALLLCAGMAGAQALTESGFSGVAQFAAFTPNNFESVSGGFKLGVMTAVDADKSIFIRTVYNQFNVGPDKPLSSMEVAALTDWNVGKKWKIYALGGAQAYLGGENSGTDLMGGVGLSRRIWTDGSTLFPIPASLDLFLEGTGTDASGQVTGSYYQINFGFKFNKAGR